MHVRKYRPRQHANRETTLTPRVHLHAMADPTPPHGAWLIAAWPGMGNVAIIAAGYLVRSLGMSEAGQLSSREHFDIADVSVREGLVQAVHLPRGMFFRKRNVSPGRDLIVFMGESQPSTGAFSYTHELLDAAISMGVDRIITFASIASALHPAGAPRVFGVSTDRTIQDELRRAEVQPLADGQIGGLNGVMLGAALARGLSGFGLLAEIPFFAANVPNPKAARAALSVFSVLTGIDVSLEALSRHAETVDQLLVTAFEKLREEGVIDPEPLMGDPSQPESAESELESDPESDPDPESQAAGEAAPEASPAEPALDFTTRQRIERLFDEARRDSNRAVNLKRELDRLGVFKQYENRFLDLFRRAG